MPDAPLSAENISLVYGSGPDRVRAIDSISLQFESGKVTMICGPSGSGKTTLLAVLGCLLAPHQGEVYVMGKRATRLVEAQRAEVRRQYIGYVFQAFRLFSALSALENVLVAADIGGFRGTRARGRAIGALDSVGLRDKWMLMPDQLSGGEKQRVAIARALVKEAPIILADEPTASLDTESGLKIAALLREVAVRKGQLVLVVSHDLRLRPFCDRLVLLRDGRVVEESKVVQ